MKTLCAAAVVLSLISVCRPAPLTCDKLLAQVENGPDITGRWYLIALSTEVCLPATLINSILWPSFSVDVTSKGALNLHEFRAFGKMYGYCFNESETLSYTSPNMFSVNSDNDPEGEPDVLQQTSCPDCIVMKSLDVLNTLFFLSRRTTVSDAEMKEFETQAKCNGWSKPQVLNTDHDYVNCKEIMEDNVSDESKNLLFQKINERLRHSRQHVFACFLDTVQYAFKSMISYI